MHTNQAYVCLSLILQALQLIIVPPCLSLCVCCQLLKSLTPEENTHCQHGLYFNDGQRHVDYVLTYHVKKPAVTRYCRQSVHLLTDNAIARSIRRGPKSQDKHLQHPQVGKNRDSSTHHSSPMDDMEQGCLGETLSNQEDHKMFRREEFEEKLKDMGLELERDEDVS